ncbi:MAG: hypothetical protein CFE29_03565 [Bradyrhizobiaceae bacterium PARB1]|jgi:hypothetical protein|nr:MAG: hypothetical protein CFE29_03565 [Bradyrhizobiaceae bacterium PARB1]
MANLNREQFLQAMTDTYATVYPGADQDECAAEPKRILDNFLKDEKIEFGDVAYDWTACAADTLVRELQDY